MKVVLYATLSANGCYRRATPDQPPERSVIHDVVKHVEQAGCVVFGRRTFEEIISRGQDPMSLGVDLVVVSTKPPDRNGIIHAKDPRTALDVLGSRGHDTVLVNGGHLLLNAFLREGLINELVLNYAPVLESGDMHLSYPGGFAELRMIGSSEFDDGVVQMRYEVKARR